MSRFAGHIVLVTGAASGIGLAAARRFLAEGAQVYLADRDADRLAEAAGELADSGRRSAVTFDATDEAAWTALADRIAQENGRLDVLVNNVGNAVVRSIAETTLAEWRATMAINLDSVFLGTRAMLPLLAASGHGAIVNLSSVRGIIGVHANPTEVVAEATFHEAGRRAG